MTTLNKAVFAKREQWDMEARIACANHGQKGGTFHIEVWANGVVMASIPGLPPNCAIPVDILKDICLNGWTLKQAER